MGSPYDAFFGALGQFESSNNYQAQNQYNLMDMSRKRNPRRFDAAEGDR